MGSWNKRGIGASLQQNSMSRSWTESGWRAFPIWHPQPERYSIHMAQDGIVSCTKEDTGEVCQQGVGVFFHNKLSEHSLQCSTATNFACQAWKAIRKHLLSRANYSVIISSLLRHSESFPGSHELMMINEHQNIQVLGKLQQYSEH